MAEYQYQENQHQAKSGACAEFDCEGFGKEQRDNSALKPLEVLSLNYLSRPNFLGATDKAVMLMCSVVTIEQNNEGQ